MTTRRTTTRRKRKKRVKPDPRPKPTEQQRESVLYSLAELAQVRRETIDEQKSMREQENDRHREILSGIVGMHQDANASLVRAVDLSYARGLSKTEVYAAIGMSGQALGKIRRRVERPTPIEGEST